MSSPDNNIASTLFKMTRRYEEKFLQAIRSTDAASDDRFHVRSQFPSELQAKIEKMRSDCRKLKDALKVVSAVIIEIGDDASNLSGWSSPEFSDSCLRFDTMRSQTDTALSTVISSIDSKLSSFDELARKLQRRDVLKLDFDAYIRKVTHLREKGTAVEISRMEGELLASGYYDELEGYVIAPEMEALKSVEIQYFSAGSTIFSRVPSMDPIHVSTEVERRGKTGWDRVVSLERPESVNDILEASNRIMSSPPVSSSSPPSTSSLKSFGVHFDVDSSSSNNRSRSPQPPPPSSSSSRSSIEQPPKQAPPIIHAKSLGQIKSGDLVPLTAENKTRSVSPISNITINRVKAKSYGPAGSVAPTMIGARRNMLGNALSKSGNDDDDDTS